MSRALCVLALGIVALVAGCSTLSVEERTAVCANSDWYRFGVNDGTLGVPSSERGSLFAECAEFGHPVDAAAYQAGRAEGLKEYCTVENGYQVGYNGRRYQQICPADLEPDFLQGYAQGRDDRPGYGIYPGLGIGIGSGGVRTGVGIGIGIGNFYGNDCYYRDPFPCGWRRHGSWGFPYAYRPYGYRPYGYRPYGYRSHGNRPHGYRVRAEETAIRPPGPGARHGRQGNARHPAPPCSRGRQK